MTKRVVYRFILLIAIFTGCSVHIQADEPEKIIRYKEMLRDVSGKERMVVLEKLARFYADTLSEVAIGYATQYLRLAEVNNTLYEQARAHRLFASIYKYQIDYRKSLKHNLESLRIFRIIGDSASMAVQYYNISDNLSFLNQFDSAVIYNDSGYKYYEKKNIQTHIFRVKLQLGKAFSLNDRNTMAMEPLTEALKIAERSRNPGNLGWVYYWLGWTNIKLGNFDEAEQNLLLSIAYSDTAKAISGAIGSKQALGELYLKTGDFSKAYDMFFQAYQKHAYVKGDRGGSSYIVQYYVNMGAIYFNIGKYKTAMQFYDSAAEKAHLLKLGNKIALTNTKKGRVYYSLGDYDLALKLYKESIAHYRTKKSRYYIADLLNEIGKVTLARKEYGQAIDTFRESLHINRNIGNKFGIAQNHINTAMCYEATVDYNAMKKELDAGMDYARKTGVDQLILQYYNLYIHYYENTGQHEIAHEYFNIYIPFSKSINEKIRKNISNMLLELFHNELEKEKQLYDQQLLLTRLEAERNNLNIRVLILFTSLILVILLLIGYFLLNRIRMTRKLEQQVEERTHALVENEKKLIEMSQTKDQFYSIIAHDLKSPFNSLIGFSNLLHDDYDDFSDEERKQFITIVRNSSEEIFALLENLLDWTRKSSENINFKPVKLDLHRLIKQTIQLQEKNALMKQISINNDVPKNTFVAADENMLRTVVRNLTSNAIKFTNPKGTISFNAAANNGFVECSVSDNGIGMNEKTLSQLFDISGKIKKKGTANEKGTGLGLLLCKDFVERHGGKLTVESSENKGSKFTFTLPVK